MSAPDPRVFKLLNDIHVSAKRIVEHLQNETLEGFTSEAGMNDQDIVARRLTIIGEAAAALLKKHSAFCEQHPEISLRLARGMRNVLVHEYDGRDSRMTAPAFLPQTAQENICSRSVFINLYK